MRLKDTVLSMHLQTAHNNNQLQSNVPPSTRSLEEAENRNEVTPTTISDEQSESQGFRIAQDTTAWSSSAVIHDNTIEVDEKNNVNNNNLLATRLYQSSSTESLEEFEGEGGFGDRTPSEWSDWSEEGNYPAGCRGIINPNYPGFQHLGPSLLSDTDYTEDEQDSCDYSSVKEDKDAPDHIHDNNNVQDLIGENVNRLDEPRFEKKEFYIQPKFNIQTVSSLCESALPPTEKCINYVKGVEISRKEEEIILPDSNEEIIVEPNVNLNGFEDSKTAINSVKETIYEYYEPFRKDRLREIPVEVEVVQLATSVKETLQFPEIEEIPDSSKTSEVGETEELIVEHIDLLREAEELPQLQSSKIGNKLSETIPNSEEDSESSTSSEGFSVEQTSFSKLDEIDLLSSIGKDIDVNLENYAQSVPDVVAMDVDMRNSRPIIASGLLNQTSREDKNKILDKEISDVPSVDVKKKEKMARNQARRRQQNAGVQRRLDKRKADAEIGSGGFDVYNIETAMPQIDMDAIETHLRAAREEERREDERVAEVVEAVVAGRDPGSKNPRRQDIVTLFNQILQDEVTLLSEERRNDREEIRRRLAMGPDADDLRSERGRKPSLQSRLQSGMNLQICFMNETSSDTESPSSENAGSLSSTLSSPIQKPYQQQLPARPQVLNLPPLRVDTSTAPLDEVDFFARQARLQTETRMALAQAKEMAHMQMEVERQKLKQSPLTEMVRSSLLKIGVQLGEERRRLSRTLLTDLNVAQLQVLANDLHARIATLNEVLVEGLLRRDDLHMEQDSMLVDVEDLTRYFGAKLNTPKKNPHNSHNYPSEATLDRQNQNHQSNQFPNRSSFLIPKVAIKPKLSKALVSLARK